ncbi:MAG TPA: Y-family DNA polymerase [Chitinophagaceae bacterium]|nr:Y-family DNA polymerase [Chitinophagaceae bacterium]
MRAIVDCNSFYCSCERLFRPDLWTRPVVVLSNNDGCIIARSDEAKSLGVDMAGPYYQQKDLLQKHKIAVFSSNYNLYGDLSMRVMDTLRALLPRECVEVYSVDEAFLDISHIAPGHYEAFAMHLRETVEAWTGIRVSVGVAPSKVLCKLANKTAKKNKVKSQCVMVLDTEEKINAALQHFDVGELWGIGGKYSSKLKNTFCINTAWQLKHMPEEWARKNLGGVVGIRMIRELNGISCIPIKDPLETKKMISSTRMFGKPVYTKEELREAVATYTARAAEKLRRQGYAAGMIDVFTVTNGKDGEKYSYDPHSDHRYVILPRATSFTNEIISYALPLVEQLFRPGFKYQKAGVVLGKLVPDESVQSDLFEQEDRKNQKTLMEAVDNINFAMRGDVVKYVSSGLKRNWKMRQEMRSGKYTTRWEELFEIR